MRETGEMASERALAITHHVGSCETRYNERHGESTRLATTRRDARADSDLPARLTAQEGRRPIDPGAARAHLKDLKKMVGDRKMLQDFQAIGLMQKLSRRTSTSAIRRT